MGLPTKAAIVTGASRGIGRAIAAALADEGHALTLAAHRAEGIEAAAADLTGGGATARAVALDVTDEAAPTTIVEAHSAAFGRLDVLVIAAGIGRAATVADTDDATLARLFAVNAEAPFRLVRAALGPLRAAHDDGGHPLVVVVASLAGVAAVPGFAGYSAAKAAAVSLAASIRAEEGAHGIRATAICPGFVDTDLTAAVTDVARSSMLRADDVAEAVRFLVRLGPVATVPTIVLERLGVPELTP